MFYAWRPARFIQILEDTFNSSGKDKIKRRILLLGPPTLLPLFAVVFVLLLVRMLAGEEKSMNPSLSGL
jgi:hypothetical protein